MKRFFLLLFAGLLLPASACWYGDKIEDGADMVMIDLLYPYWAESTYFACWNMNMYPQGGYFYGGVAGTTPPEGQEETYRPGTVWSFWPADSYEGRQVRNVYANREVYAQQYIGEGASGSAGGRNVSWLKPKQWYTSCIKTWGTDEKNKECFVGWWIKDKAANQWHHLATFKVPCAATGLTGNGGFLEDFGNAGRKQRELWRGQGFYRLNGAWKKCDTVEIDIAPDNGMSYQGWNVHLREDDSYLSMSHTGNKEFGHNLEPGQKHVFTLKQPERPALDELVVSAEARQAGNQVIVDWALDGHSSPQLGYRIDVYDNPACEGEPLAGTASQTPHIRTTRVTVPGNARCTVKLVVTDIFDQQKQMTLETAPSRDVIAPVSVSSVEKGLEYAFVEMGDACEKLADADFDHPKQSGISRGLDTALRGAREDRFAFDYKGYLRVPENGAYTFVLRSCDGSRLELGGQVVIDNDGVHSASEVRKTVLMKKGLVPIRMSYFRKDGGAQYTGLWLGWEYGGNALVQIGEDSLVRERKAGVPAAKLAVSPESAGQVQLKVATQAKSIDRIEYYNGTRQIAVATTAPYAVAVVPFEGGNEFWARVCYHGNKTVDTEHVAVTGKSSFAPGWDYAEDCEPGLARVHRYDAPGGVFSFTGDGEYLINREIEGDFEMTARIRSLSPADMDVCRDAWVGLMLRAERQSKNYDNEIAIFRTVGEGLKCSADFSDLGTGRKALFKLDDSHFWVRIKRQGNRFTCLSSADGKTWVPCLERIIPLKEKVYAGVTFRTIPGQGRGVFSAAIDSVGITAYQEREYPMKPPRESGNKTLGYSKLEPGLTALRLGGGVILLDRQQSGFKGTALPMPPGVKSAVSMASDGTRIYLVGKTGGKGASDAFVTEDQGKTWAPLAPGYRIDPARSDMKAGELIGINPRDSQQILLAGSREGLYATTDGGATWNHDQLKGELVSCIAWHPVVPDRVCALTADPVSNTGKLFLSRDAGRGWEQRCEVRSTGFLNMVFDTRGQDMFYLLSTNGIYTTFNECRSLNRCLHVVPSREPWVAADVRRKDLTYIVAAPCDGKNVYRSDREWLGWETAPGDPGCGGIFRIDIDPEDFDHITAYGYFGISESRDAGATWKRLWNNG